MNPIVFIPLVGGRVTVVDFADFDAVRAFRWNAQRAGRHTWYAKRTPTHGVTILMHRAITGFTRVDHVNGDGLDNRRQNLREATHAENMRGFRRKPEWRSSRYRGVTRRNSRWEARIRCNGVTRQIGTFSEEKQAAMAYDAAARELGFFPQALNFPP